MKQFNGYQKLATAGFVGLVGFWLYIKLSGSTSGDVNYWYSFLFGLVPLIGGLVGMFRSRVWGGLKSQLGRAVFFISLGLVLWGVGECIWSYYNFFKNDPAPYPSWADLGFAPSIFFWIIGVYFLAHASGAWLRLKRSWHAKVYVLVAIAALTALSYYLLVKVARDGTLVPPGETALKVVLDIAYPLGDFLAAILAFIVLTLSFKYLGGIYKYAIGAVLLGLFTMYIADFVFSYTTTTGTYYNADWGDLLLSTGLFMLTFGILGLSTKPEIAATTPTTSAPPPPETPAETPSESAAEEPAPAADADNSDDTDNGERSE
jgi:hypothetical protein